MYHCTFFNYMANVHLFNTGSPTDDLMSALESSGICYDITANDDGEIQSICWTTLNQLELLTYYGDVFMLDGTYKVCAYFLQEILDVLYIQSN